LNQPIKTKNTLQNLKRVINSNDHTVNNFRINNENSKRFKIQRFDLMLLNLILKSIQYFTGINNKNKILLKYQIAILFKFKN
jgi:hypothetical protein